MSATSEQPEAGLSKSLKDKLEGNRKAVGNSQHAYHPYLRRDVVEIDKTTIKIGTKKFKDTGGGFLLEEEEPEPAKAEKKSVHTKELPGLESDQPNCIECNKPFVTSWLCENFDYKCCDQCKDPDDKHKLITKTDALNSYLLRNYDLDKREPVLRCITRKNPHNVRWGEMKLYLQIQVEERALEVWGSEEKIQEEKEKREEKKVLSKSRKYQKELKALRMNMRSSLYDKTHSASHNHEFGPETYNESDDTYTRNCLTCSYTETFEKM